MGNMWRGFFAIVIVVAIFKAPYCFLELFNKEEDERMKRRNVGICILFWLVIWALLKTSGNK